MAIAAFAFFSLATAIFLVQMRKPGRGWLLWHAWICMGLTLAAATAIWR